MWLSPPMDKIVFYIICYSSEYALSFCEVDLCLSILNPIQNNAWNWVFMTICIVYKFLHQILLGPNRIKLYSVQNQLILNCHSNWQIFCTEKNWPQFTVLTTLLTKNIVSKLCYAIAKTHSASHLWCSAGLFVFPLVTMWWNIEFNFTTLEL